MKYLLLVGIVLAAVWLWRNSRRSESREDPEQPTARPGTAQRNVTEIVACDVCHVHLPRSDALIGQDGTGVFCCDAHRNEAAN